MSTTSFKSTNGILLVLTLSFIGAGLAGWLTYIHVRVHIDPAYVSVCAIGEKLNCETVAASTYSVFWGLPVSVWGLTAYLVIASLTLIGYCSRERLGTDGIVAAMSVLMAITSLGLAFISTFVIQALCLFCTATYIVNIAIAFLAAINVRRRGGLIACLKAEIAAVWRMRWPAVGFVALAVVVLIAGPGGGLPKYWELASWRDGPLLPHGFDEDGYPWIGATHPKLVVHEFFDYECPHCRVSHRKLRRLVHAHADELRVVRHDFARLRCAPNDPEQRLPNCSMTRAAYCAGKEGRYWHWNDLVYAHPKPLYGPERLEYEIETAVKFGFDRAAFDECMYSAEAIDHAQRIFIDASNKRIRETPSYYAEGKRLTLQQLTELIADRL